MHRASLVLLASVLTAVGVASACQEVIPPNLTSNAAGDAGLPPLEMQPPAVIPPDKRLDGASSPVVFDPVRGSVWVANGDVGTLSNVDIDAQKVVGEVAIGQDVRGIALSPDAVWVAAVDRAAGAVTLVDAEKRVARRTLLVGSHPRAAVWDAANPRWLYVAVEDEGTVAVIDRTLGTVTQSIPVGRMPSGVAVSRKRNELYVTHRIDAKVSVVDLGAMQLVADVPLADQPADVVHLTVPNGKPFAFEGLAWQPDGDVAWLPHELFAPTHPFQFNETVFPAISVVDLSQRLEVTTSPNSGKILGRKVLFDAINIPDAMGNTSVVSQPCAVALHPNAIAGYALACGSEDLLTFDQTQGIAVGLVRQLAGDHPVGLTLDDTGQRLFIASDQSHTLLSLDVVQGDPIAHPRVIGGPLSVVAKDPLDPDLRAGQTLFQRANSQRGDYATTGNDWLSCGACHLDGFGSATAFLFEAARVIDPTVDAQIGHERLADLFSTAPTPKDTSFDPHDVLVAFIDQGGLQPDRTGKDPMSAADPANPPAAMRTMATQTAMVVARDLAVGPSWLSSVGQPTATFDTDKCGECHKAEYQAWQASAHAHAGTDPMMLYCVGLEQKDRGTQYSRLCAGCHDPVNERLGDSSLTSGRGVTCLGCHEVTEPIRAGGNGDLRAVAYDWRIEHKARATAELAALRRPDFCGGCHEQFVPGTGLTAIGTRAEYAASPYAVIPTNDGGAEAEAGADSGLEAGADAGAGVDAIAGPEPDGTTYCVDCHMTKTNGVADHGFPGGNVYLASPPLGDGSLLPALQANLQKAVTLTAATSGSSYVVAVHNVGVAHSFPTGVTDIREPWVELQALDASKNVLAHFGGPDATTSLLPPTAARLGTDIARADGGAVLLRHELSEAARIPFDQRVPSGGELDLTLPKPASLPTGTAEVDAVLLYRNVRTTYYQAATGGGGAAPATELARVKVGP